MMLIEYNLSDIFHPIITGWLKKNYIGSLNDRLLAFEYNEAYLIQF